MVDTETTLAALEEVVLGGAGREDVKGRSMAFHASLGRSLCGCSHLNTTCQELFAAHMSVVDVLAVVVVITTGHHAFVGSESTVVGKFKFIS